MSGSCVWFQRGGGAECTTRSQTPTNPPPLPSPATASCRRQLYDAALRLERRGAALVERPLALVDAVLSPSAALVVCDNSARKLVRRGWAGSAEALVLVCICQGGPTPLPHLNKSPPTTPGV